MLIKVSAYIVKTLEILVVIPIGKYGVSFQHAFQKMVSKNTPR